jgi:ABC-type transporter Mla subunit MlaD
VLGAFALAIVLGAASGGGGSKEHTYKMVFDNAFGLVKGGDFRVGGVKAGQTTGFDLLPTKVGPPKALVTAKVSQPGVADFRTDARCEVRPQSLIGEYFVDCQPGHAPRKLKNGGMIPVQQTISTVPQDLITDVLRAPYRERLRILLTELGTTVAGRPQDIQAVLKRAHPGFRVTSQVLQILGRQNRIIQDFVGNADTVIAALERNKSDVVRFVQEAGKTAAISATRRPQIRESIRLLPRFLSELRPTMVRLGQLSDQQIPLLTELQRAAPDLNTFLRRLGPFSEASRPAVRALGSASTQGTKALQHGRRVIDELRTIGDESPAFAKPLRQFLQASDSRSRAIENDPRAAASAPPAPDPTAINGQGGFTAFEDVWNYAFWQTLSINMRDSLGSMVRLALTLNQCSPFMNKPPDPATRAKCNSYLGPDQPGVTTPDPTTRSRAAARARAASLRSQAPARGVPGAGKPVPGYKPQVELPPALKELLGGLPNLGKKATPSLPTPSAAPAGGQSAAGQPSGRSLGGNAGQLLDYLLGP